MRRRILACPLGLALLVAAPAAHGLQAVPVAPDPMPAWQQALYKTLTYESLANASDLALSALLIGGTALGSGFLTLNVSSSIAAYYAHEYAWTVLGPLPEEKTHQTIAQKTVTYRVLSTARSVAIGLAFGGSLATVSVYAAAVAATHTGLYVGNEYAWDLYRTKVATP